jgi:hypothetical protein
MVLSTHAISGRTFLRGAISYGWLAFVILCHTIFNETEGIIVIPFRGLCTTKRVYYWCTEYDSPKTHWATEQGCTCVADDGGVSYILECNGLVMSSGISSVRAWYMQSDAARCWISGASCLCVCAQTPYNPFYGSSANSKRRLFERSDIRELVLECSCSVMSRAAFLHKVGLSSDASANKVSWFSCSLAS